MLSLSHQDFPLEESLADSRAKFPVLNIVIDMLNLDETHLQRQMTERDTSLLRTEEETKFNLMIYIVPMDNGIEIQCLFNTALYLPELIEKVMQKYVSKLSAILTTPEAPIKNFWGQRSKLF